MITLSQLILLILNRRALGEYLKAEVVHINHIFLKNVCWTVRKFFSFLFTKPYSKMILR